MQRRRLDAVDVSVVAEAQQRGVAGEFAQTGVAELLLTLLRIDPAEARRRANAALDLGPRVTLTGETLPPLLPGSADALRGGVVSAGQVEVIRRCLHDLERIPELAVHEVAPVVERVLLDATTHKNPDGTAVLRGHLTAEAAAVWDAIFDSIAAPTPASDGTNDDRTAGQRRHDAFLDAGRRLLRSGSLPDCGGAPVTVS